MASIIKKCEHTTAQRRSCKCNWVVRYRDSNGRQREKSYLWNQKEIANTFATTLEADKKKGAFIDPKLSGVKFRDAADKYVNRQRNQYTAANYRRLLEIHIDPVIGGMTISAVASQQGRPVIENLLTESMPAEPNPLGIGRIHVAYAIIKAIINAEIRSGALNRHHLHGIELDPTPVKDFVFPEYEQLKALADEIPAEYQLAIWLMRGCGLRIGEALGLSTADFIAPGVLRVHKQLNAKGLVYGPLKHRKEGEFRDVPVPGYVMRMVTAHTPQDDGHLFKPLWHNTFFRWFDKARDAAGIDGKFTRHSLRHLFASVSLANGVPITDVSKWLGHKDINLTYSVYGHLMPNSWERAAKALDSEYDAWSGTVGKSAPSRAA